MTFRGDFYLLSLQSEQYKIPDYNLSAYSTWFSLFKINDSASVHSPDLKKPNFSVLFPQECWRIHGWGWEFCSKQFFTYIDCFTLKKFEGAYACWMHNFIYREITVLYILNLLHTQTLLGYIICAIVLQIHFTDIYQHNNQLCLHYNQTWLMTVKSSHFMYLHTEFLPALSPNRQHKISEIIHKFWSHICKSCKMSVLRLLLKLEE